MDMNENANMQTDELEKCENHAYDNLSYMLPPTDLLLHASGPTEHKNDTEQELRGKCIKDPCIDCEMNHRKRGMFTVPMAVPKIITLVALIRLH